MTEQSENKIIVSFHGYTLQAPEQWKELIGLLQTGMPLGECQDPSGSLSEGDLDRYPRCQLPPCGSAWVLCINCGKKLW